MQEAGWRRRDTIGMNNKIKKQEGLDYLELLRERKRKSRITVPHQLTGLTIAEMLKDDKHKSLYMKLAKKHDNDMLIEIAKDVANRRKIKNKGAYFMTVLQSRIAELSRTKTNSVRDRSRIIRGALQGRHEKTQKNARRQSKK